MSRENIELMRAALEAFNVRDLDAMLALADPNCEWHSTFAVVGGAGAMPIAQVWKIRGGLITYCKTYTDRDEALRDLGASEEVLEPIKP
jgi:ketosteroid isomerase-like protein